jgi:hypothetical protein
MPTYYVRNDTVQNGLGQAIPNVAVTYYTQPSLALASVYSSATGGATTNPLYTNGLGQTTAYLAAGFYTITYSGAQIQTLTLADQEVGAAGSGSTVVPFAGIPQGTINGVNRTFTLTNGGTPLSTAPTQSEIWNNYPLVSGVGYTLTGVTIVYTTAPVTGDTLWAQGVTIS